MFRQHSFDAIGRIRALYILIFSALQMLFLLQIEALSLPNAANARAILFTSTELPGTAQLKKAKYVLSLARRHKFGGR